MKRLIPLGSMIWLLISSANVFALPKIKRIRISRTGTRLQRVAKETIVNGKLRYIHHGVSETTRATASTTAQQVERAAEQAQHNSMQKLFDRQLLIWSNGPQPWKKLKHTRPASARYTLSAAADIKEYA